MNIVVTGAFRAMGISFTRVEVEYLCEIVGWVLQDNVNYRTQRLYALDPDRRTSKRLDADRYGVPVANMISLAADLNQALRASGMHDLNWYHARGQELREDAMTVRTARIRRTVRPERPSATPPSPDYRAALQSGLAKHAQTKPVAFGQLNIRRKINLD